MREDLVVTEAPCLVSLHERQVKSLAATFGEHSLFQKEKQEQNTPVSNVIILQPAHNGHGYMSSDIALLCLTHTVKSERLYEDPSMLGIVVQQICLPHRGDKCEDESLCMASGWGEISESKRRQKV